MTERRLEHWRAVHRGDLILSMQCAAPFAGPEEQDRVCLDANVMLARRAAGAAAPPGAGVGRLVRAGACQRMALSSGSSRRFTRFFVSRTGDPEQFVMALPGHSEHQTGLCH